MRAHSRGAPPGIAPAPIPRRAAGEGPWVPRRQSPSIACTRVPLTSASGDPPSVRRSENTRRLGPVPYISMVAYQGAKGSPCWTDSKLDRHWETSRVSGRTRRGQMGFRTAYTFTLYTDFALWGSRAILSLRDDGHVTPTRGARSAEAHRKGCRGRKA